MQINVKVFRFDSESNAASAFQTYTISFTRGMTVLDALVIIQTEYDPTLAFRWECANTICGTCTVSLNDMPVLACKAIVDPESPIVISPIANFPVKKDLVVDLQPALTRLNLARPYLISDGRELRTQAEADASKKLRACIECWACVAVCPAVATFTTDSIDPAGMVKLARYHLDPRDTLDRPLSAAQHGLSFYHCETCRRCLDVCPQEIDVFKDAILVLREQAEYEA